jgi:hypothetical protein
LGGEGGEGSEQRERKAQARNARAAREGGAPANFSPAPRRSAAWRGTAWEQASSGRRGARPRRAPLRSTTLTLTPTPYHPRISAALATQQQPPQHLHSPSLRGTAARLLSCHACSPSPRRPLAPWQRHALGAVAAAAARTGHLLAVSRASATLLLDDGAAACLARRRRHLGGAQRGPLGVAGPPLLPQQGPRGLCRAPRHAHDAPPARLLRTQTGRRQGEDTACECRGSGERERQASQCRR